MKRFPSCLVALAALFLAVPVVPVGGQQTPADPILPNAELTPGATLEVTLADIRQSGYSSRVRNVPVSVKRAVYAAYHIQSWGRGQYEIDHLIPICIGGSNSTKNLWPESCLTQPWNAKTKNRLERRLMSLVRKGTLDLRIAQQEIASNWIEAYKKYVDSTAKESGPTATPTPTPAAVKEDAEQIAEDRSMAPDEEVDMGTSADADSVTSADTSPAPTPAILEDVWVNTKSHVIWKPGTAWYGKTQHGKYMTAAEAEAEGDRYAYHRRGK